MSKVSITRSLLDDLAMSISAKSGEAVPLTLTEMKDAVDDIQVGSTTIESLSVTENGTYTAQSGHAYSPVTVSVPTPTPSLQTKTKTYTPTASQQTETISADSGYDGLDTVSISVGAIDSNYVGTGITRRSSTDLTASGATVTVPSGYYSAQASKSVASGTAGTPTATKGTVSNHSISVTPSVTNTTGYITGSTKTGTAVTVSASELVSGSQTITSNQTVDVTNLAELVVNVASGSSKNTQIVQSTTRTNASTLTAIGAELTVSKTGTYDIYYSCFRTNTSSSYTWATRLYINGTAYGTAENATWTNNQQNIHLSNISLTTDDKLRVYGRNTRGTSYYICAPMLVIIEA